MIHHAQRQIRVLKPYEDLRKPCRGGSYNKGMIRPITPADIEAVVALTAATDMFKPLEINALREVLDDYFEEEMARGHVAVVWEDADQIAGFTYYGPVPLGDRTWQLWWIAVAKTRQGTGVGSRLLRHAEDDMRRKHGRLLFIETGSAPLYEPTRHFYRKFGYEQHALLQDYYADGDSMVIFRKAL
jgi:ribosomal protein S18 acetylase RimI-like enzyme